MNDRRLKGHHYQAISLLAQGYTHEQVGEIVNINPRQVSRWLTWPEFQEELEAAQRRLFESAIAPAFAELETINLNKKVISAL